MKEAGDPWSWADDANACHGGWTLWRTYRGDRAPWDSGRLPDPVLGGGPPDDTIDVLCLCGAVVLTVDRRQFRHNTHRRTCGAQCVIDYREHGLRQRGPGRPKKAA